MVRPFDWGLDWLDLGPPIATATVPADAATDPPGAIGSWVNGVMQDTSAFFGLDDTNAYQFTSIEGAALGKGGVEEGVLRFPSAFVTPHPENNTVVARWFPSAGEPRVGAPGARGRAVVVMPQDRKSTRLNSSHVSESRMPSSA